MSQQELPQLLSASEIALLPPDKADEYLSTLEEYERYLDRMDVAKGLTLNLQSFFRKAWAILEPETPLVWSWHYDYLCEWLTMISSGEFKRRYPHKLGIVVNVPPRSGKSLLLSVVWPTWTWLENPQRRFLCASYSGKLAGDHSAKRRLLINSNWFQEHFSDRFSITTDRQDDFRNDKTGYFISTSVEGSGTGFGGDICLGDDLLSALDAHSKTVRLKTNNWLDDTFRRRLNNPTTGVFVHISQRLTDDDPTGHLLEHGDEWIHIKIQREAVQEISYTYPLSGHEHTRPEGDILQPERYPPEVITSMKAHSREWAGQEQQEPAPAGGVVFDPNWWQYYNARTALPTFDIVVLSVDCAFKGKETSDNVSIQKWGRIGSRGYLLQRRCSKMGYIATKAAIKQELREQEVVYSREIMPRATLLLIEDKANGSAVIEEFKRDRNINCTIIAVNPEGGKDSRAYSASADVEAGNIYLPEDAPWIGEYVKDFSLWSGEGSIAHDDDIDATSQFINWMRKRQWGMFDWWKEQANAQTGESQPKDSEQIARDAGTQQIITHNKNATTGIFGAEVQGAVKPSIRTTDARKAKTPECEKCGNKVLSVYGDTVKCVCGWTNKKPQSGS